ncbi:MAG: glycosyltransferase family 2 protein [Myxococcales bacterium]|nr:glycosyltransferase family 2 protein [Myxococcales bacterium]
MTPYFSAVIPVFNEEGNLPELHRRLRTAFEAIGRSYEIIFVDDGSRDASFDVLRRLHDSDPNVRVLKFSRNFGHHLAITAGVDAARGEAVIMMDSDLQDLPEEIEKLHDKFLEGYDVVFGIRQNKRHSVFKRVTSKVFTTLINRMIRGTHSINTHIFRIVRRNVIDVLKSCREQHRFIVGLISWAGFRQIGVPVEHGARFAGETKYSLGKMIRLALNSITSFTHVPLQLATYLGTIVSGASFLFLLYIVLRKLIFDTAITGWTSLMVAILFFSGVQLFCLGLIGEYLGRTYSEAQRRPLYIVDVELGVPLAEAPSAGDDAPDPPGEAAPGASHAAAANSSDSLPANGAESR